MIVFRFQGRDVADLCPFVVIIFLILYIKFIIYYVYLKLAGIENAEKGYIFAILRLKLMLQMFEQWKKSAGLVKYKYLIKK